MYKKVLITSTGEYLDEIIEHTLNLVNVKMEVIGLYVADTSTPFLTPTKIKEMMANELENRGKDVLKEMGEEFKKSNQEIIYRPMLEKGDPAEKIVKISEKEDVDVIIMGTGKSKIDKHFLGSVSEKVVHSAPCTVLLIRTKQKYGSYS
jgi:nucleotide-binding universal stress UspA family protein